MGRDYITPQDAEINLEETESSFVYIDMAQKPTYGDSEIKFVII